MAHGPLMAQFQVRLKEGTSPTLGGVLQDAVYPVNQPLIHGLPSLSQDSGIQESKGGGGSVSSPSYTQYPNYTQLLQNWLPFFIVWALRIKL